MGLVKVGRGKKRIDRILDRDNWRCGIHLQGCGGVLKKGEGDVGHIVPKVVLRGWGTLAADLPDRYFQPMHVKCNREMSAEYPPKKIRTWCDCCRYVYLSTADEGRLYRPVISSTMERKRRVEFLWIGRKWVLGSAFLPCGFERLEGESWELVSCDYTLGGLLKDGTTHAGPISKGEVIGAVMKLDEMVIHNVTNFHGYKGLVAGKLSSEEKAGLEALPWGSTAESEEVRTLQAAVDSERVGKPLVMGMGSKERVEKMIRQAAKRR